jgi:hypothetical protein
MNTEKLQTLIERIQHEVVPGKQAELQSLTESRISYDIDWSSFGDNAEAVTQFTTVGFNLILDAFRILCQDDLDLEAIREKLSRIVIHQTPDRDLDGITVVQDVVRMPWRWGGDIGLDSETVADRIRRGLHGPMSLS